jgi:histone-lysine N-methyltransferase NSD2
VGKNGGGTCGDDCENRQTMFECMSSVCHADCQNQRLQKRQYPRLELFKTADGRGWGLRALEDIPKGSLVQEYIGEVLTTEAFRMRAASYGPNKPVYFFNINSEMVIDASAMGSMARFINHSCGPNCHTEKWSVGAETRIAIVSSDAIPKGSEVTYNYEFESFGTMQHKCMCGAPNCRYVCGLLVIS